LSALALDIVVSFGLRVIEHSKHNPRGIGKDAGDFVGIALVVGADHALNNSVPILPLQFPALGVIKVC
jgi:hypothetical protein